MRVEDFRETDTPSKEVEEFDSWGIPTALNLSSFFGLTSSRTDPVLSGKVLSSGGLRTGMDGLKSLALGASLFGMALPVALAHKSGGYDGLVHFLTSLKLTLQRGMFLLGVKDVTSLPNTLLVATQEFAYKTEQLKRG
jgi:isopentenyl diphosphate isomerase/L-lactate dehydrogenase-like FMN-dependent dehydrogenase